MELLTVDIELMIHQLPQTVVRHITSFKAADIRSFNSFHSQSAEVTHIILIYTLFFSFSAGQEANVQVIFIQENAARWRSLRQTRTTFRPRDLYNSSERSTAEGTVDF